MTLEFQPPFQINPYAQSHGERSLNNLSQTFDTIGNQALQYRQQQIENARQKQIMDWKQAEEDRARQANQPLSDFFDPSAWGGASQPGMEGAQPSSSLSQGTMGSQPNMTMNNGQPGIGEGSTARELNPTEKFMAWKANQSQQGQNPLANFDPNTFARLPGSQRGAYSGFFKEKGEYDKQQSEIQKNLAMAKMYGQGGPNAGYVWKQNPFTGEYEAYPTKPGMAGAPGQPPLGGAGQPPQGQPTGNNVPPIPGETYQARAKRIAEKPKALGSLNSTLHEYDNMINQAEMIKKDPSLGTATGLTSFMGKVPNTGAKRVATNLDTLKAQTLLNVISSLKQLSQNGSSGFGQLSNVEGETIKNSIASLDRTRGTADFVSGLDQFINEMKNRKQNLADTFRNTYGDAPGLEQGGGSGMIRVRNKQTGQTGQLPVGSFDATKYDRI